MTDSGRPPSDPAPEGRPATDRPGGDRPGGDDPEVGERKRVLERTLPEFVKRVMERALETGVEKLTEAPENIRELMADMKLPREATHYFYEQVDDTKKGVYKIVAKEIRDVLEHMNFADEIADVLTKLQFEINTTIRFVPNKGEDESADGAAGEKEKTEGGEDAPKRRPSRIPRPKVVAKVAMKARDTLDSFIDDDDDK